MWVQEEAAGHPGVSGFAAFLRWAEVTHWPWMAKARGWIKTGKTITKQTRLFSFPSISTGLKTACGRNSTSTSVCFQSTLGKWRGGQGSQSSLLFITVDHSLKHDGELMLWSTCGGFIPLFISCYQRRSSRGHLKNTAPILHEGRGFFYCYSKQKLLHWLFVDYRLIIASFFTEWNEAVWFLFLFSLLKIHIQWQCCFHVNKERGETSVYYVIISCYVPAKHTWWLGKVLLSH